MSDSKSTSGGIGFFGLLTIAFIVLKLCKVIDWSWWWVTCPLWGSVALVIIGILIYLPFKIRKQYYDDYKRKTKWQERLKQMQEQQKEKKHT